MAQIIQISGFPASGKSFSIKNLDPKSTLIIDCDGQGLAWAGWKKDYNKEAKNYFVVTETESLRKCLAFANSNPNIKTVVIDTLSGLMDRKYVEALKKPNFDKWTDLSTDVYSLYQEIKTLRDDLNVVVVTHLEAKEHNGETHYYMRLPGKLLSRLNLTGLVKYILIAKVEHTGKKREYYFETQSDGYTEARSPYGVFEEKIPNDLQFIIEQIQKSDI